MELPEQVRNRIRAEEVFREASRVDVARKRASRSEPKTFRQWLWASANSPLGIWFLSTVVAGLLVLAYTEYSEYSRQCRDRHRRRDECALEVQFRTNVYQHTKRQEKEGNREWTARARKALDGEYKPKYIYPQFEDRPLVSLLQELVHLCDKQENKKAISKYASVFLMTLPSDANLTDKEHALQANVDSLRKAINELLGDGPGQREQRPATIAAMALAVWMFLNSHVGGWLLATLLVGSALFLYVRYAEYRRRREERRMRRHKIAVELAFRSVMYDKIREGEHVQGASSARSALDGERKPYSIYPEFTGRPLVSLLWELSHLCDKEETKKAIGEHIRGVPITDALTIRGDFPEQELHQHVESLGEAIAELLSAGRKQLSACPNGVPEQASDNVKPSPATPEAPSC